MVKRYKEEGKSGLLHKSINKPSNNAIGQNIKQKCKVLWNWIKKYGIPLSIYCDKRNIYILEKDYEELNNEKGYFRQMCHGLNIKVITANSPQAKGKVERSNQTHQDRLIKKMRLLNIRSVDEANKYLKIIT